MRSSGPRGAADGMNHPNDVQFRAFLSFEPLNNHVDVSEDLYPQILPFKALDLGYPALAIFRTKPYFFTVVERINRT